MPDISPVPATPKAPPGPSASSSAPPGAQSPAASFLDVLANHQARTDSPEGQAGGDDTPQATPDSDQQPAGGTTPSDETTPDTAPTTTAEALAAALAAVPVATPIAVAEAPAAAAAATGTAVATAPGAVVASLAQVAAEAPAVATAQAAAPADGASPVPAVPVAAPQDADAPQPAPAQAPVPAQAPADAAPIAAPAAAGATAPVLPGTVPAEPSAPVAAAAPDVAAPAAPAPQPQAAAQEPAAPVVAAPAPAEANAQESNQDAGAQPQQTPQNAPAPAPAGPNGIQPAPVQHTLPSAPPAHVAPLRTAEAVERIHALVHLANANGAAQARLDLHPAELGGVTIQLRVTAQGLHAHIAADRPEALPLLEQAGADLRKALVDKGVQVQHLDFGMNPDAEAGAWRDQGRAQQDLAGELRQVSVDGLPDEGDDDLAQSLSPTAGAPAGVLVDVKA